MDFSYMVQWFKQYIKVPDWYEQLSPYEARHFTLVMIPKEMYNRSGCCCRLDVL